MLYLLLLLCFVILVDQQKKLQPIHSWVVSGLTASSTRCFSGRRWGYGQIQQQQQQFTFTIRTVFDIDTSFYSIRLSSYQNFRKQQQRSRNVIVVSESNTNTNIESSSSVTYSSIERFSRADAADIINDYILPSNQYGNRIAIGLVQSSSSSSTTITSTNKYNNSPMLFNANDPILHETYGEFPLSSFDQLLDRAVELLFVNDCTNDNDNELKQHQVATNKSTRKVQQQQQRRRITVVDVGSGCGRLALYLTLCNSRQCNSFFNKHNDNENDTSTPPSICWDVHGIELSSNFHSEAIDAAKRAVQGGWLIMKNNQILDENNNNNDDVEVDNSINTLQFHLGPADEYQSTILSTADIIFCYSTAFGNGGFNINNSAMVLDQYWSTVLSSSCRRHRPPHRIVDNDDINNDHCINPIIITTEKIIDPLYDTNNINSNSSCWNVVDRIDVPNPEVFSSTGYMHQRKRTTT